MTSFTEQSHISTIFSRGSRLGNAPGPGGGGHWPRKGVWGCAAAMTPFFLGQSALPSLPIYHHCAALVPPPPHFKILEQISIFSLVLVKISALKTQICTIFVPKTPHFSKKIRSLDPTFGNPCGTHPPKKKVECPPPPGAPGSFEDITSFQCLYFFSNLQYPQHDCVKHC